MRPDDLAGSGAPAAKDCGARAESTREQFDYNFNEKRKIDMNQAATQVTAIQADPEEAAMAVVHAEFQRLRQKHPEWIAVYDDSFPDSISTRAELAELMAAAPTEFALGLIYGKFSMRLEISSHTGIDFH